jgi:hypothetical protein
MTTGRQIVFTLDEDFAEAFASVGLDPATLDDYEWRKFEDAFCEGTHWSEVAEIAAGVVQNIRLLSRRPHPEARQ